MSIASDLRAYVLRETTPNKRGLMEEAANEIERLNQVIANHESSLIRAIDNYNMATEAHERAVREFAACALPVEDE